jgi:flagellar motor switch protein FliM
MSELLTNEEIDTLLELFRAEAGGLAPSEEQLLRAVAAPQQQPASEPLDLLTIRRFAPRSRLALERAFGSVDRSLARAIGQRLRAQANCECVAVERLRWSEWATRNRSPMHLFAIDLEPLARHGLMALSTDFLNGAIDRLLGGTGRAVALRSSISDAEVRLVDDLIATLLAHLADALAAFVTTEPEVVRRVPDPALAAIVAEHDPVLAVRYELAAESLSGELRFVLPFHALEQRVRESVDASLCESRTAATRAGLTDAVREVPLEVRAVLGRASLPLRTLLGLRVGDVVSLDTRVGDAVEGLVQGRRALRGWLGPHNGRMSLRMTGGETNAGDE